MSGDEVTLAGAYQSRGEIDKAKSVLQISMYQHVLSFMSTAGSYLMLVANEPLIFSLVLDRILPVGEALELNELNANVMAQIYYGGAHGYAIQGRTEESIDMLRRYSKVCKTLRYPYKFKGDKFFDRIDEWLKDLDLGNGPPRGEKIVKEGMLQAVTMNPAFTILHEETGYKNIVSELTDFIGGH